MQKVHTHNTPPGTKPAYRSFVTWCFFRMTRSNRLNGLRTVSLVWHDAVRQFMVYAPATGTLQPSYDEHALLTIASNEHARPQAAHQ